MTGSPHFAPGGFFCPGLAICGATTALHVEPKAEVFEAFLASCFA